MQDSENSKEGIILGIKVIRVVAGLGPVESSATVLVLSRCVPHYSDLFGRQIQMLPVADFCIPPVKVPGFYDFIVIGVAGVTSYALHCLFESVRERLREMPKTATTTIIVCEDENQVVLALKSFFPERAKHLRFFLKNDLFVARETVRILTVKEREEMGPLVFQRQLDPEWEEFKRVSRAIPEKERTMPLSRKGVKYITEEGFGVGSLRNFCRVWLDRNPAITFEELLDKVAFTPWASGADITLYHYYREILRGKAPPLKWVEKKGFPLELFNPEKNT